MNEQQSELGQWKRETQSQRDRHFTPPRREEGVDNTPFVVVLEPIWERVPDRVSSRLFPFHFLVLSL